MPFSSGYLSAFRAGCVPSLGRCTAGANSRDDRVSAQPSPALVAAAVRVCRRVDVPHTRIEPVPRCQIASENRRKLVFGSIFGPNWAFGTLRRASLLSRTPDLVLCRPPQAKQTRNFSIERPQTSARGESNTPTVTIVYAKSLFDQRSPDLAGMTPGHLKVRPCGR